MLGLACFDVHKEGAFFIGEGDFAGHGIAHGTGEVIALVIVEGQGAVPEVGDAAFEEITAIEGVADREFDLAGGVGI